MIRRKRYIFLELTFQAKTADLKMKKKLIKLASS